MRNNNLTAQMMVKNEEQWIWYAIQSLLPFVDKMLIFDTGSTDKTIKIIKSVKSKKIIFKKKESTSRSGLTAIRNEMLDETNTDWFILIDGDEVWPRTAIQEVVKTISKASQNTWGLVVRTRNCVQDIWHYQPESAGKYELLGRKGHLTTRIYKKLGGFSWIGEYPLEAYSDKNGKPVHDYVDNLTFIDVAYWHLSHLKRSTREKDVIDRAKKRKIEKGIKAKKQELPEVFFQKRPSFVPSPWIKPSIFENTLALTLTPLRNLKRKITR